VDYELGVNPFEAERSKFIEAINHISQLPNLEMNFRRGDSLHDYICGHPVRLDGTQLADYTDDLARIEKSGQELHQAKRAEKKKRLRLEILAQRLDLGKRVVTDQIRALSTNQQVGDLFGLTGSDAASYESFAKFLKDTVMDETVPAGIPPAVSWDDLAAKKKWSSAQLKKAAAVRGKLNVPRERFQINGDGEFVRAGRN
jgi:hypothetical protein